MSKVCDNGRRIGGGKYPECPNLAIHTIVFPAGEPLNLCDRCFQIALALGHKFDLNIGAKEAERRERARLQSLDN